MTDEGETEREGDKGGKGMKDVRNSEEQGERMTNERFRRG